MSSSYPEKDRTSSARYNPGNLRWKYTLDSIIERERNNENRQLVNQLMECLNSLAKYPLVLEEVTHCAILHGFNADIINMMKEIASLNEAEKKIDWRPIKNLENWNLSPISKKPKGKYTLHPGANIVNIILNLLNRTLLINQFLT